MAKSVSNTRQRLSRPFEYARKESKGRSFILLCLLFAIVVWCVSDCITSSIYGIASQLVNRYIVPITVTADSINLSNAVRLSTIILICLYVTHFEKRSLRSMGFIARHWFARYLGGLIAGFLCFAVVVGIAYAALGGSFHLNADSGRLWPFFVVTGICFIIQGLAEEVMLRGYFLTSLGRRYGIGFSAIVSAIAFSLLHFQNPGMSVMAYINIFLTGIFLAQLFYRTESIWTAAAWHAVWNFVQGSFWGLRVSGLDLGPSITTISFGDGRGPIDLNGLVSEEFLHELWSGGEFGLEASIGCTILMLALILLEGILIHAKMKTPVQEQEGTILDHCPIPIPAPAPAPPATTAQTMEVQNPDGTPGAPMRSVLIPTTDQAGIKNV